jgi:hypothetical protein
VGSGNFADPKASAAAEYTINNALISGPDASNFAFAGASGTTGEIKKAALEYSGVERTSVFNGATQTNSGATLTSGTIATGESFTVGGYAQQRNVLATPTPDVLVATPGANTLASNYTISYNHGSLGITPAPLTATVTAGGLTYNGSRAISSTTVLTGFVGGATGVAGATTLTAATANAGVQTIINDGTVLAGTESANYSVTNTILASTASNGVAAVNAAPNGSGYTIDIAKAPLTYTSSDTTVTYNGAIQTNAPATLTSGSFAAGQGVTISGYAAATTAYEMPLDDLVATANSGTNLSNYAITFVNGSLTINPAPLTISGLAANNKTFDRNTNAVISGTPTLAGQIFAGDDVAIESGSVTQGVFASSSVSRTNPTPVSVNLDGFVLSNSNYYIQGPTQPLAARINAVVTTTAPPQNPAPAPQPVTPAPQPAAPQEPEAKELNNMVLLARQNESQAFLQSTLVQTKPNDMRKLNLLFVRDNESRTEYLNVLPVPSSGAFKFPIPDQITQELIVLSGEHVTVVGAPASFYGHKLLRLPDQSVVKASLADGSALPQGIQFNAADMTFSVPKLSDVNLPIYVKLSLVRGNAALSEKTLLVEE